MNTQEIELYTFLARPVADLIDAADAALGLHTSSRGATRESAHKILVPLYVVLEQLAPETTSAHRWNELAPKVRAAVGL